MDAASDPPHASWRTPTGPDDTPGFRRRNKNVNATRRAPTLGRLVSGLGGRAPADEITPAAQTSAAVASAARYVIAAAPMPVVATRGNDVDAQALRARLGRVATTTTSSAAQEDVTRLEEMLRREEDERGTIEYAQILELKRARAAEMAGFARVRRGPLREKLGRVAEEIGWGTADAAAQGEAVRLEGRENEEEYEKELRGRLERLAREKPDAAAQEDVVVLEERQWGIFEHARVPQARPQGASGFANLASQRERDAARFEPRTMSNAESAQKLRNILGRRLGSVPAAGPAGGLDWVGQLVTDGDAENAQLLGAIRGSNYWWDIGCREQNFRDMLARCSSEIARHAAIQALYEVGQRRRLDAERAEKAPSVPLTRNELLHQMYRGKELVRRPVNAEREDYPREPNPGEDSQEDCEEERQRSNRLADDRDAENEQLLRTMLERRHEIRRGGGLRGSLRGGALPLREQEWADQLIGDEDDVGEIPRVVIAGAEMIRQVFPGEEVLRERVDAEREDMPVENNPGEVVQQRGRRLDEAERQRYLNQGLVHRDVNFERREDPRELIPGVEEPQPANRLVKAERRHNLDQARSRQRCRERGVRSPSQEQHVYMDREETFRASPEEAAARFMAINRATRADLELGVHQLMMIRRKRALSEPDQVTIWKKSYRFDNDFESSIRSSMHLRQHGPDDDPRTYQWKEEPRAIHYLATESTKPKHYLADFKERDISELDLASWYNAIKAPPLALGYAVGWIEPPWKGGLKEKWVQEHGGRLPVQIGGWPVTADMQDATIPPPDKMEFERRRKNERIRRRVEASTPIDPPGGWREVNWGEPRTEPWDEQIDPLESGPPLDDNPLRLNRRAYQATQAVNALSPNDVPRYVIPRRTRRVIPPPWNQTAVTSLPIRARNHPGNAPSRTLRNDDSGFQFDDLINAGPDLNSDLNASNQRLDIASQHTSTMLPAFGGSGGLLPNPMAYAHCPAPTSAPPQHLEGAANASKSGPGNPLQVLTPSEHQGLFRRQLELNRMQLRALEYQQVYGPAHTLQTAAGVVGYQHFNESRQLISDHEQRLPAAPASSPPPGYFSQGILGLYNVQLPLADGSSGYLPEAMIREYVAALQPPRSPPGLPIPSGNLPSRTLGTDGHHAQVPPPSQTPQQPTDQIAPAAHFNILPIRAIVYAPQGLRPPPVLSMNRETFAVPEEFVPNHSIVTTHRPPAAPPPMMYAAAHALQKGHPPPVLALNAPGNLVRGRNRPNSHDVPTATPPSLSMYATASDPALSPPQLHDEATPSSQPSLPFNTNMHAPGHYFHLYRRPQPQVPATPLAKPATTEVSVAQAQEPRAAAAVDVPGLRGEAAALTPETPSVGPAEAVKNKSEVKPMSETTGDAAEGVWTRRGAMQSASCDGIGSRRPEMRARGVLRNRGVRGQTYTVGIGRERVGNRNAAEEDQIQDPISTVTMRGGSAEDELLQRLMPGARVNVTRDENHAVIMGIVEEADSSSSASPPPEIIEGARLTALIAEDEHMQPHILGAMRSMEPQAGNRNPMQLDMSLSGTTSPDILGEERRVALGEMRADLERIIGALDGAGDRILELMDRDVRNGLPLAAPERQPAGLMGLNDHSQFARNPLVRARSAENVGGLEHAASFGMAPWRRQAPAPAVSGAAQPAAFLWSPPRPQQPNPGLEEVTIEQAMDQLDSDLLFEIDRELADNAPVVRGALGRMNQHEGIEYAAPIANPLNRSPSPEVVEGAQTRRLNRFQERLEAFGVLGEAVEETMDDIAEIDEGLENGDQELMEEIIHRPAPTIPPGFGPSLVQDLEGNIREGFLFGDTQGHAHPPAILRRASDLAGPRTPPMRPRSASLFGEVRNPYEPEFRLSFQQEQSMRGRIAIRRAEMEAEAAMRRLSLSSADYTDNSSNAATMTVVSEEGIAQDRIDLLLSAPWRPMGPRTIRDYAFEDFVYAVPSGRIGGLRHAQTYMEQIARGPGGLPVPDIWYQFTFHTRAHHCIDQQKLSLMPLAMVKNLLTDTDHWYDLRREVHLALEELAIDPKSEGSCVAIAEFLQALREVVQDLRTQVENGSDRQYDVVCEVLKFADVEAEEKVGEDTFEGFSNVIPVFDADGRRGIAG